MRIRHLIIPGALAGAEKVVIGGAAAQQLAGADVGVWVGRELRAPDGAAAVADALRQAGVATTVFDVAGRIDLRAVAALRRMCRDLGRSVVHAHGYKASLALIPASAGLPITRVATHHGETSHDARVRWYARAMFAAYRRFDRVIAVSASTRERLLQVGVDPARVDVVENFASLSGAGARRDRVAGGRLRLVTVGRLSPEKGLDVLARALADERLRGRAVWTVIGDGGERDALEALAQRNGVDARFVGFVDDVGAALADADVFVMPSLREGMPMALLEALASGLPAIVSAVGSMPSLVDPASSAVVGAGDVRALADALVLAEAELPAWSAAAIARSSEVAARFSPARWAEETARAYGAAGA